MATMTAAARIPRNTLPRQEVSQRQGECLIGQDMGHGGSFQAPSTAEPRCQRSRIQKVPGVEKCGQEHDGGPAGAVRDQAHGGELCGASQNEHAHRGRFDERESCLTGSEAINEPEAHARSCETEASED